jgi:predicted dehydrogenase
MDLGCYCVHVARSLVGEPDRVYAEQVIGVTGVELALQGTLHFSEGVVAHFDSSFIAQRWQDLELVGDLGSVRLAAPFHVDWGRPGIELARGGKAELIEIHEQDSYALELENFVDAGLGGEPLLPAADSVGQARAIAALYEAAERSAPITV